VLPALTVTWHPDPERIGDRAPVPELSSSGTLSLSRLKPDFGAPGAAERRPLTDPNLSRTPITLRAAGDHLEIHQGKSGTPVLVDGQPLSARCRLPLESLDRGVSLTLANRVVLLLHRLRPRSHPAKPHWGLLGASDAMIDLRADLERAARHGSPVLLRGETGTGKELAARALHEAGPRRDGPYVALNLAALAPQLAAAELFGAARGAFTGAARERQGYFRRAHQGTLFLDEIGEIPEAVQPLLLRALESGTIEPVGSTRSHPCDVRLVTATDADLEKLIETGRFRAPLLHRLNGIEIRLPPLRERREDLGRLLLHFLRRELEAMGEESPLRPPSPRQPPTIPGEVIDRLLRADWPGNVRQLRNTAGRLALALVDPEAGPFDGFPRNDTDETPPAAATASKPAASKSYRPPHEVGLEELRAALRASAYRLQPTARRLGISRTSLYTLIDRHPEIRRARDIDPEEIAASRARHDGDLEAVAAELEVSRHGLLQRLRELGQG
jgi:two-component system nitrogen regulation response regulator GlnG